MDVAPLASAPVVEQLEAAPGALLPADGLPHPGLAPEEKAVAEEDPVSEPGAPAVVLPHRDPHRRADDLLDVGVDPRAPERAPVAGLVVRVEDVAVLDAHAVADREEGLVAEAPEDPAEVLRRPVVVSLEVVDGQGSAEVDEVVEELPVGSVDPLDGPGLGQVEAVARDDEDVGLAADQVEQGAEPTVGPGEGLGPAAVAHVHVADDDDARVGIEPGSHRGDLPPSDAAQYGPRRVSRAARFVRRPCPAAALAL